MNFFSQVTSLRITPLRPCSLMRQAAKLGGILDPFPHHWNLEPSVF